MANGKLKTLDDFLGIAPRLKVTCLRCGRVRLFDAAAIVDYFKARVWSRVVDQACQRFVCRRVAHPELGGIIGCGSHAARLEPSHQPLPPRPPPPPPLEPQTGGRAIKEILRRRRG